MIKDSETIGGLIARWWKEDGQAHKHVRFPIVLERKEFQILLSIDDALKLALRLADMIEEADNDSR